MARWVSRTLRVGVGLSALLALAGLALLLRGSTLSFTRVATQGTPVTLGDFATGLAHGSGVDVLILAFLVLIATPLARVVISVGLFASVHDRPFTALTLAVLALLGASALVSALV